MIGDFFLSIKIKLKKMFCKHDYKPNRFSVMNGEPFMECAKCGKTKNLPIT